MNERVDKERKSAVKLKQKVQLHVSLNTEDQVRRQNVSDSISIQDLNRTTL